MSEPHRAMYWSVEDGGAVSCGLCPHGCVIPDTAAGICGVRENRGGVLYAAGYGHVSAAALDPIEKKPLYMFHPGKRVLSVGAFGCNLRCPFCQNSEISIEYGDSGREGTRLLPEDVLRIARDTVSDGNIGVAYTYNEPLVGYEFVYDCARLVRGAGMQNVLVTNGYINREPMNELLPYIDAVNIDLKGFSEGFYAKLGGRLAPVMETVALARQYCHVEITTLIVPGENDSESEISKLAAWLASIDPGIPLHLTRFFPRYKYSDKPPTSLDAVQRLCEVAKGHLRHVFAGNIW